MTKEKNKNSGKGFTIVINTMIIILTIIIIFLAWQLIKIGLSYAESRKEYNELREFIISAEAEPGKPAKPDNIQASESSDSAETVTEDVEENVFQEPVCDITVDFKSLWDINPDIKGWIYQDVLEISYPIVQGADNNEYLYTSVKGTANKGGSIFMEALNHGDFSDPHTIIYGHNMKDGSMFGKLKKLYDQELIDNLNTTLCFWIITPEGKFRYDVFSIHTVDAAGDTYTLFTEPCDEVGAYMNKMAKFTGVELPQRVYNSMDKVITLSTCTGNDQYRLVVQGVLHIE